MMRNRELFRTIAHPAEGISKVETIYPIRIVVVQQYIFINN
jgi:hypothetical protein